MWRQSYFIEFFLQGNYGNINCKSPQSSFEGPRFSFSLSLWGAGNDNMTFGQIYLLVAVLCFVWHNGLEGLLMLTNCFITCYCLAFHFILYRLLLIIYTGNGFHSIPLGDPCDGRNTFLYLATVVKSLWITATIFNYQ